jgi:asparagine synthase (glutamine-hydrolysing)
MCGIAGLAARTNNLDLATVAREMTDRVQHRGPDSGGVCVRGQVALGTRRLSIIDLSASGHQPMTYADDRYAITYNGEIYNYLEIRSELESLGYSFRSHTDTEVVLASYAAWGAACLDRFNGMWAFAIHDSRENVIFAARDRFGVKPFYYVLTGSCFAFGSEIRQLLPLLPSVRQNPQVVSDFLLTGVQVQSSDTFFGDVQALLPGNFLTYQVSQGELEIHRYYSLRDATSDPGDQTEQEALTGFRSLLEDAVRLRLRSDVKVGTCLSGGLDSSSIALIASRMNQAAGGQFTAVTAISEDPGNNEEAYAQEVVRAGSLDWVKSCPGYDDFRTMLPHVVRHQEEPFSTPSICMQAFVMQAARQSGTVVLLDGQGGDENLLGYDQYYPAYYAALWHQGGAGQLLLGFWQARQNNVNMSLWRQAAYAALILLPDARTFYYRLRSRYAAGRSSSPAWVQQVALASRDVRELQALEIETTTLPPLLRFEDKNAMSFSIETRLPFLDYRLVEYAVRLPIQLKIRHGWTKWLLRQAMDDVLPHDIAWRRNKIGFAAPTGIWVSRHLDIMTEKVKDSSLIARFCDMHRLMQLYRKLSPNHQWRLFSLALWEEEFSVGL